MAHDRIKICEAGRRRVMVNFMWEKLAAEIFAVIESYI